MTIGQIIGGIYRRIDRYVKIPLAHSKFKDIEILDPISSIQYIIEHRCSVSRFEKSEFDIIQRVATGCEKKQKELYVRLLNILTSTDAPNHIIGFPYPLKDVSMLKRESKEFWDYYTLRHGTFIRGLLSSNRTYVDMQLTRFYSIYEDKSFSDIVIQNLKRIWDGRDIVIVGGTQADFRKSNGLYDNAKSVLYIPGTTEGTRSTYEETINDITHKVSKDKLILLCHNTAVSVKAYDLARLGYWAIDMGYIDIEYECYHMLTSPQKTTTRETKEEDYIESSTKSEDNNHIETNGKVKVSIIIPVYNAAERIGRCINSVLAQEMEDFECILIDDGSTDNSPVICDMYAKQDERIKVVHKKNGGVGSARNTGLECAKGKWVVFVDSDDSIKGNHLSSLFITAEESEETDCALCGYYEVKMQSITEHSYPKRQFIGKTEIAQMFYQTDILNHMTPWDKIFRRSVIKEHQIRFNENLAISEDRLFCYEFLRYVRGVAMSSAPTYLYDSTDSSSLSSKFNPFPMLSHRYEVLSAAMKELVKHYELKGEESLSFINYDWSIFKSAIYAAEAENSNIIKAVKKQRQFYDQHFEKSLYSTTDSITSSLLRTKEDRFIFNDQFVQLNLYMMLRRYIRI